jgi:protein-L-isoaspartate(D-aspartate) O-methyltransferase
MATRPSTPGPAEQRLNMVNGQLKTSAVTDPSVLAAFLAVSREIFVAPAYARLAYLDQDQPATGPAGRRLLAPRTLALLLQAARIDPATRALDIGGGSGYGAALLAHMGATVVALESDATAARAALAGVQGIETVEGDLAAGAPSRAPFDVILIHGAFEILPAALLDQLAKGGRLLGVDARDRASRGVIVDKAASGYSERGLFDTNAKVLDSFERERSFAF